MNRGCEAELKVAACQMRSIDDVSVNQRQINRLLKNFESEASHVDLISFPENSLFFRIKSSDPFSGFLRDDLYLKELSSWAKKYKTHIHLGSVALKSENAKFLNATVWINSQGELSFPYNKIHLFDVDVIGEPVVRESDFFTAGSEAAMVCIDQWKIGLSICYDLRFSELYLRYAKANVDLILVPSAFLVTTGQAHWHSLLRARAIEAQAYVVAAAQGGEHLSRAGEKRYTYGHSLIVGPWGEIMNEVNEVGPDFIVQSLKRTTIDKVRKQIPMQNHRKLPNEK